MKGCKNKMLCLTNTIKISQTYDICQFFVQTAKNFCNHNEKKDTLRAEFPTIVRRPSPTVFKYKGIIEE